MAEKEATIFIIDVGKSMGRKRNGRDISDLDWSLKWVWDRLTNIVYLGRKTLFVGVIALGSDVTQNNMSEDDSYKNINILQHLSPMAMPELRSLSSDLKASSTDKRDAMSAIILAVDMIMRHCKHLKFNKKIYLVTNATGPMDPDDIDTTAEQIKQNSIELTVLGVDFDDPAYGYKEEDKLHTKAKNERLLRDLVDKSGGVLGTMSEAHESLSIPNIKPVRPTPTYKGQLRLGDPTNYDTAITIDIERYFKISIRRPPTASSFVVKSSQSQSETHLATIQNNRIYTVPDLQDPKGEKIVDRDELARGYQYGRTAVPISESDENITKLETVAGYEILGFIPKDNVERYMLIDNTNMLVSQRGNDKAAFALSSIIHALFEIDSCAIARFVKKDMAEPTLTVLTPYADDEVECLIENILPYSEDLRQYRFPPIDRVVTISRKNIDSHRNLPGKDLLAAMDEFVDGMTIKEEEELNIEDIYSPVLHSVETAIKYRAVNPTGLPQLPEAFTASSRQPQHLQEKSKSSLQDLIQAADVKKVPPKVKGRRKQKDPEKPLSGLDIASLFPNSAQIKISSENAIPEFKQLMEKIDSVGAISDAANQFASIIENRIRDSYGDKDYERVIEELRTLRDELKEYEEFEVWHKLIRRLKSRILDDTLGGFRGDLWFKIRVNKLGLIDKTMNENSNVTPEDAAAFLSSR